MLLILMYHRVHGVGQTTATLETHLTYLRDHHHLVLPGEKLEDNYVNVCLTFDDATVDFYYQVFPLLAKLGIRALVAVPTAWIKPATDMHMEQRLMLQDTTALNRGTYALLPDGLCTWQELAAMQASGLVQCAVHGHNHLDMRKENTDVLQELALSLATFDQHLQIVPDTFIYPYGRSTTAVQMQVARRFIYAMRIGSAINRDWAGNKGLLYRVDAERFWPSGRMWSFTDTVRWRIKYLGNMLRNK